MNRKALVREGKKSKLAYTAPPQHYILSNNKKTPIIFHNRMQPNEMEYIKCYAQEIEIVHADTSVMDRDG